jgi:hypothetical protein
MYLIRPIVECTSNIVLSNKKINNSIENGQKTPWADTSLKKIRRWQLYENILSIIGHEENSN